MTVNGFVFDLIGNLVSTPDKYTVSDLGITLNELYKMKQYISASRIQHLINIYDD